MSVGKHRTPSFLLTPPLQHGGKAKDAPDDLIHWAPCFGLGYLFHKNPARVHSFPQTFGTAYVFYPEITPKRASRF